MFGSFRCLGAGSSLVPFFLLASPATAATPDEWRGRNIYQILTDRFWRTDNSTTAACDVSRYEYCGGTWKGIEYKLDYIQNMGFDAIWISPVTKNMAGGYHGYWQTSLSEVNANFGAADDLKSLSAALHGRGMYLMVDVVTNHFGSTMTEAIDTILSTVLPSSFFHSYCPVNNDDDDSAVKCWVANNLVDVATENPSVVDMYSTWIKWLIAEYGIDGLRIDSAKNVDKSSLKSLCEAAGVYCLAEVADGNPARAYAYKDVLGGGGIIDYPMYDVFAQVFVQPKRPMSDLAAAMAEQTSYAGSGANVHGTFTENHDSPRVGSYNRDAALATNALAFTFMAGGIPVVYQGQEQHLAGDGDPHNREAMWLAANGQLSPHTDLYNTTASLAQMRNWAAKQSITYSTADTGSLTHDHNQILIKKDVVRTLLTNAGANQATGTFDTQGAEFLPGEKVVDLLSCAAYTASPAGEVTIHVGQGMPVVMMTASFVRGSGMCGY